MEEEEPPSYELKTAPTPLSYEPLVYLPKKTSIGKVEEDEDGFIITWDEGI